MLPRPTLPHRRLAALIAAFAAAWSLPPASAIPPNGMTEERPTYSYHPYFAEGAQGQCLDPNHTATPGRRFSFIPNAPRPLIDGRSGTIAFWFRHTASDFYWEGLFDVRRGDEESDGTLRGPNGIQLYVYPGDATAPDDPVPSHFLKGAISCELQTDDGSIGMTQKALDNDRWYHAALTWGAGSAALYVDGTEVARKTYKGVPDIDAVRRLCFGCNYMLGSPFKGRLDELMVFNRTFDAAEVKKLFEKIDFSKDSDLTLHMPFDGNSTALTRRRAPRNPRQERLVTNFFAGPWSYLPLGASAKMGVSIPPAAPGGPFTVSAVVTDASGKTILRESKQLASSSDKPSAIEFESAPERCGVYTALIETTDKDGKTVLSKKADFGVTVKLPPATDIPSLSPVGAHLMSQTWKEMPAWRPLGVKWTRYWGWSVAWFELEPEKGIFYWDFLDKAVDESLAGGQEILFTVIGTPVWASACPSDDEILKTLLGYGVKEADARRQTPGYRLLYPAKDQTDWNRFLRELFRRYKGKIKYYELWNEPNSWPHFAGTAEQYVELLKTMHKAMREEDPGAKLVGACGCPGFLEWTKTIVAKGAAPYLDIVSLHNYNYSSPITWARKRLIEQTGEAVKAARGEAVPLWNSEFGFPVPRRDSGAPPMSQEEFVKKYGGEFWHVAGVIGLQEERNTRWEVQAHLTALLGGAEKNFLHGTGYIGVPSEKGVAFAALSSVLGGMKSITQMATAVDDSLGMIVEGRDGRRTAILFSDATPTVFCPMASTSPVKGMDLLGNPIEFTPASGGLTLRLSEDPVYVFDVPTDFHGAIVLEPKVASIIIPGMPLTGEIFVANPLNTPARMTFASVKPGGWSTELPEQVELGAGESKSFPVTITTGTETVNRGIHAVNIEAKLNDTFAVSRKVELFSEGSCEKLPSSGDPLRGKADSLARVTFGKPNPMFPDAKHWQDAKDLSFTAEASWQKGGAIHLTVNVTDNALVPVPDGKEASAYNWDAMELFVDFRNPKQVAANPNEKTKGAEQIFVIPTFGADAAPCKVITPHSGGTVKAEFTSKKTPTGYLIVGTLTPGPESGVKLETGAKIGLDIAIDDADDADDPATSPSRKAQITWKGGGDNYKDPNKWGRFILSE